MIDKSLIDLKIEEHYVKKGDPSKPTYYIVRPINRLDKGLLGIYLLAAGYIYYALSKGYFPVVDVQNYKSGYLPPEKFGKENAWEYYFEQPLRIGLEEAYNSENVILGDLDWSRKSLALINRHLFENRNHDDLIKYLRLINSGLLMVKPAIMKEILSMREKLFSKNDRVLGVKLRGTDYVAFKPKWHFTPPHISLAVDTVRTKLKEWNCNKIFLATEDYRFVEVFKNTFGDLCITTNKEYVDYDSKKLVGLYQFNRDNDHFLRGKEYLTEIVILSMCNSFVGVVCQGATAALVMSNNRFENIFAFNLGQYK
ncbi:MAG: hypothetical protein IJK81_04535 [Selenomonadaceae bacterium]|nr:hypothetical protein [Selenomonadaceae bacterium]